MIAHLIFSINLCGKGHYYPQFTVKTQILRSNLSKHHTSTEKLSLNTSSKLYVDRTYNHNQKTITIAPFLFIKDDGGEGT